MENLSVCSIDNAESVSAVSETLDSKMEITEERKSKRLSPEQKEQILTMFKSGIPRSEIAEEMGCSLTAVNDTIANDSPKKIAQRGDKSANDFFKEFNKLVEKKSELEKGLANSDLLIEAKEKELKEKYEKLFRMELEKVKQSEKADTENALKVVNESIDNYKAMFAALMSA